ncbi:hypothetical protein [Streptomyces sp. WZ-12]|nr:hypothetical protein [Streptomyces sp. WZ-12]
MVDALAFLADAGRIADEARTAGHEALGHTEDAEPLRSPAAELRDEK